MALSKMVSTSCSECCRERPHDDQHNCSPYAGLYTMTIYMYTGPALTQCLGLLTHVHVRLLVHCVYMYVCCVCVCVCACVRTPTPFTPFFSMSSMNRERYSGDFSFRLTKYSKSCKIADTQRVLGQSLDVLFLAIGKGGREGGREGGQHSPQQSHA